MIRVKLSPSDEGREMGYREGMTVRDVLERLKFHPASTLKFIGGVQVGDERKLKDGEELLLIPVIGGG